MAYLGTDSTESSGGSAGFDISIDARFTNNTISGNHAMGATTLKGGGVFIHTMRHATVEGNTIVNNTSDFQGGGIFLQRIHSDSTIGNNTISGNTSGRNGGGCYVGSSSYDYYLKDTNSIVGNSLTDPEPGAKVDLYSYKTDDVLPEDTE
jgi:parallel beta-helix repeat protein